MQFPTPEGLSELDEKRIKTVAAAVASSCHCARYQHLLQTRQKSNPNFSFLDERDPLHEYYQYCLQVYTTFRRHQWLQLQQQQQQDQMRDRALAQNRVGGGYGAYEDVHGVRHEAPKDTKKLDSAAAVFLSDDDDQPL